MRMISALLIELYLVVVAIDWVLAGTRFQVNGNLRAQIHGFVQPYVSWVRATVGPTFNGVDLSHATAIALLLVVRAVVLTLLA